MADTPDSLHSTQRDAAIIDPHLPEGYSAEPEALVSDPVQPDTQSGVSESHEESSLMLQGGDIHRDIYDTSCDCWSIAYNIHDIYDINGRHQRHIHSRTFQPHLYNTINPNNNAFQANL